MFWRRRESNPLPEPCTSDQSPQSPPRGPCYIRGYDVHADYLARDSDRDHDHDHDPDRDRDRDHDRDHDPDRDSDHDPDPDRDRDRDSDHNNAWLNPALAIVVVISDWWGAWRFQLCQ